MTILGTKTLSTLGRCLSWTVPRRWSRPPQSVYHNPSHIPMFTRDQGGKGRHCFAWFSRDVRAAGGSLVVRKHELAHSRMAGQRLVEAVAGGHIATATSILPSASVSPASLFFPLDGRLVQAHLQAERRKRLTNAWLLIGTEHFGLPRTRKGEAELKQRSTGRGAADDFSSSTRALSPPLMMLERSSWDAMWLFHLGQLNCFILSGVAQRMLSMRNKVDSLVWPTMKLIRAQTRSRDTHTHDRQPWRASRRRVRLLLCVALFLRKSGFKSQYFCGDRLAFGTCCSVRVGWKTCIGDSHLIQMSPDQEGQWRRGRSYEWSRSLWQGDLQVASEERWRVVENKVIVAGGRRPKKGKMWWMLLRQWTQSWTSTVSFCALWWRRRWIWSSYGCGIRV